jgi:hypothetical protein
VPVRAWEFDSPLAYNGNHAATSPNRAEGTVIMASKKSKTLVIGASVLVTLVAMAVITVKAFDTLGEDLLDENEPDLDDIGF